VTFSNITPVVAIMVCAILLALLQCHSHHAIQVTFVAVPLTVVPMALVVTFMILPTLSMLDDDASDGVAAMLVIIWGMAGLITALAGSNYWWFCRFIPFTTANDDAADTGSVPKASKPVNIILLSN